MSIVGVDEYLKKGHQVDLDYLNLDTAIRNNATITNVPASELATWKALYSDWNNWFAKNIKDVPILPWQDTGELDTWLTRLETWKVKVQKWAAQSGNKTAQDRVQAMPESPAVLEHRENPPSAKGVPTWAWLLLGIATLGAAGYSINAVARIGGR